MSRGRSGMFAHYLDGTPMIKKLSGSKGKITVLAVALIAGLLNGCGATRPSKYYQLTVPPDVVPTEKPDAVPITLLLGTLAASHLYREDSIVFSNGGEELGTYGY